MNTLLGRLREMPPYMVRLLAKNKNRAMTCDQIMARSGLRRDVVKRVSDSDDWMHVKIEVAIRFMAACGVELMQSRRINERIKRTNGLRNTLHIRRALSRKHNPPNIWKFYERLLAKMPKNNS